MADTRREAGPAAVALTLSFYPCAVFGSLMLSGFVCAQLWAWFVAPLGVRPISMWHAAGLLTLAGLAKVGLVRETAKSADVGQIARVWLRLVHVLLCVLMVWGFGALDHALQGAAS